MSIRSAREPDGAARTERAVAAADALIVHGRGRIAAAIQRRMRRGLVMREQDVYTALIGPEQVERLLATADRDSDEVPPPAVADDTPLGSLGARMELSATQLEVLAVLLAFEIDPTAARLAAYLCGNPTPPAITVDAMVEIVYAASHRFGTLGFAQFEREFAATGSLRRLRIVQFEGGANRPLFAQSLRLHPRALAHLLGRDDCDPELTAAARFVTAGDTVDRPEDVAIALAACRAGGRLLVLSGPPGVGRELLISEVAHRLDRRLLVVSARNLRPDAIVAAFREACLGSAMLAFSDGDELAAPEAVGPLTECLAVHPETVAVLGSDRTARAMAPLRPLTVITLRVPAHDRRLALWRAYLGGDTGLGEEDLRRVAGLYNLGVGGIRQASAAARELCEFDGGTVRREHLRAALRERFSDDLSSIAVHVEIRQRWEDLVLPDDIQDSVRHLIARIGRRGDVLGRWGFARKLGSGLSLSVLLSGAPGTGKTLLAGLVARELGLDLYRVDLSRVTSKWVGETEKNLGRAFDAAEAGHVLLLFDEADSVLGKRTTEQRSANDRYANLETNYILARLEQFQGVAFFTTNLPSSVDAALLRRMTMHIKVPFPDHEARAELWRRILPDEVPRDGTLDFDALAERYDLAGGYVRNIMLRAAYLAAEEDAALGMRHIEAAAKMEYHERGSLNIGGRLE